MTRLAISLRRNDLLLSSGFEFFVNRNWNREVKTLAKRGNSAVQSVEGETGMCFERFDEPVAEKR